MMSKGNVSNVDVLVQFDLNVDFLGLLQNANVSAKAANFKNKAFLLIHSMADGKFTTNSLNACINPLTCIVPHRMI